MLLTATSVTVFWAQPPLSFTPVDYAVTLTRDLRGSCPTVEDSREVVVMPNVASMEFDNLHEFSTYIVTVTARFSELLRRTASRTFMTGSARE